MVKICGLLSKLLVEDHVGHKSDRQLIEATFRMIHVIVFLRGRRVRKIGQNEPRRMNKQMNE